MRILGDSRRWNTDERLYKVADEIDCLARIYWIQKHFHTKMQNMNRFPISFFLKTLNLILFCLENIVVSARCKWLAAWPSWQRRVVQERIRMEDKKKVKIKKDKTTKGESKKNTHTEQGIRPHGQSECGHHHLAYRYLPFFFFSSPIVCIGTCTLRGLQGSWKARREWVTGLSVTSPGMLMHREMQQGCAR